MTISPHDIQTWLHQPITDQLYRGDEVLERFHAQHPRTLFFKTLPARASVLDMGAGDVVSMQYAYWLYTG